MIGVPYQPPANMAEAPAANTAAARTRTSFHGMPPRSPAPGAARLHAGSTAVVKTEAMALFTLDQARIELARLRPVLDELVTVRADVVELAAALNHGEPTTLGGLPEWKAAEARLNELMTDVQQVGVELKGIAPLLVDFPAEIDGREVLLCWLEAEPELAWYHRADLGFAGRRPL